MVARERQNGRGVMEGFTAGWRKKGPGLGRGVSRGEVTRGVCGVSWTGNEPQKGRKL